MKTAYISEQSRRLYETCLKAMSSDWCNARLSCRKCKYFIPINIFKALRAEELIRLVQT